jgi:hypothetical protein
MGFFQKIGRWGAGRLQGSKGVQKYDGWMERNPWAESALGIADGLAVGAATGGIGGALAGKAGMAGAAGRALRSGTGRAIAQTAASAFGPRSGGWQGQVSGADGPNDMAGDEMSTLNRLRGEWGNDPNGAITDDPLNGVDYQGPDVGVTDRAWAENGRFDGSIPNDALDQYRNRRFTHNLDDPSGRLSLDSFTPGVNGADYLDAAGNAVRGSMAKGGGYNIGASTVTADDLFADQSELEGFNADASFEKYMTGANNRFMTTLQNAFKTQKEDAAGGNRLNAGFFDLDRGKLGQTLRQDFSNDVANAALATNAQNLTRAQTLAGNRVNENTALRDARVRAGTANQSAALEAAIQSGRLNLESEQGNVRNLLAMADMQRGDRQFTADRFDKSQDTIKYLSELRRGDRDFEADRFDEEGGRLLNTAQVQRGDRDFRYGTEQDWMNREDRRRTEDSANARTDRDAAQNRWQAQTDARFRGAGMRRDDRNFTEDRYRDRRNTYMDWLSGGLDRRQASANAAAQRAADAGARRQENNMGWAKVGVDLLSRGVDAWKNRRPALGGGTPAGGSVGTRA